MTANAPGVSFEFFPSKSPTGEASLWTCFDRLAALKPAFMTMTYGAGGSSKNETVNLAAAMAKRSDRPVAAHLTLVATTRGDLKQIADQLWNDGVRHIVALRGDLPAGKTMPPKGCPDHFDFTSDFVSALKRWHDFEVSVGAYPEKHPDAPSLDADIEALRKKCGAGANRAITQFFFDNELFYRFRDKVAAAGIKTPIIPGILPIMDYTKMVRIAAQCQASVPGFLSQQFEKVKDDPDGMKALAADVLMAQVAGLAANGVSHLHFYTLNNSALPIKACAALGIFSGNEIPATPIVLSTSHGAI